MGAFKVVLIPMIIMAMTIYPNGSEEPWTLIHFDDTWELDPINRHICSQSGENWSGCTIVSLKWIAVDTLNGETLWHEILHARGYVHNPDDPTKIYLPSQ